MQQAQACRDDSVPTSRISVLVTVKFKRYRVCCALPELVTPFALFLFLPSILCPFDTLIFLELYHSVLLIFSA